MKICVFKNSYLRSFVALLFLQASILPSGYATPEYSDPNSYHEHNFADPFANQAPAQYEVVDTSSSLGALDDNPLSAATSELDEYVDSLEGIENSPKGNQDLVDDGDSEKLDEYVDSLTGDQDPSEDDNETSDDLEAYVDSLDGIGSSPKGDENLPDDSDSRKLDEYVDGLSGASQDSSGDENASKGMDGLDTLNDFLVEEKENIEPTISAHGAAYVNTQVGTTKVYVKVDTREGFEGVQWSVKVYEKSGWTSEKQPGSAVGEFFVFGENVYEISGLQTDTEYVIVLGGFNSESLKTIEAASVGEVRTYKHDTDKDGIPDELEGEGDFDLDGIENYKDTDSDGDFIPDSFEWTMAIEDQGTVYESYHLNLDSDKDGLPDRFEGINGAFSSDEDGDKVLDGEDADTYIDKNLQKALPDEVEKELIEALNAIIWLSAIPYVTDEVGKSDHCSPGFRCRHYSDIGMWMLKSKGYIAEYFHLVYTNSDESHAQLFLQINESSDPVKMHRFIIEPQTGNVEHYWMDEAKGSYEDRKKDLHEGFYDAVGKYIKNIEGSEVDRENTGLDLTGASTNEEFFGENRFGDYEDYVYIYTEGQVDLRQIDGERRYKIERWADIYNLSPEDVTGIIQYVNIDVPDETLTAESAVLRIEVPTGPEIAEVLVTVYETRVDEDGIVRHEEKFTGPIKEIQLNGLKPETDYLITVDGLTSDGDYKYSSVLDFKTKQKTIEAKSVEDEEKVETETENETETTWYSGKVEIKREYVDIVDGESLVTTQHEGYGFPRILENPIYGTLTQSFSIFKFETGEGHSGNDAFTIQYENAKGDILQVKYFINIGAPDVYLNNWNKGDVGKRVEKEIIAVEAGGSIKLPTPEGYGFPKLTESPKGYFEVGLRDIYYEATNDVSTNDRLVVQYENAKGEVLEVEYSININSPDPSVNNWNKGDVGKREEKETVTVEAGGSVKLPTPEGYSFPTVTESSKGYFEVGLRGIYYEATNDVSESDSLVVQYEGTNGYVLEVTYEIFIVPSQ